MDTSFGPYRLKRQERVLIGPEGAIDLSARSFDILCALLDKPGEVIGKDEIFAAVWPGVVVEENTLQVHVSALRKVLPPDMIVTVHGRGYKYAGAAPQATEPGVAAGGQPRKPVIVVLPFANLSGDPGQQYFSDGVTEDIGDRLTRFRSFTVIGQHSAAVFRGDAPDLNAIRQRLGADFVVSGSIRRAGDQVRIAARLADAATGAAIWAGRYDRQLTDIFAVQDEMTGVVAATIAKHLDIEIGSRAARTGNGNFAAYEWILKGHWHFGQVTKAATGEAARCYRKALDLDPANADAMGALAVCMTSAWLFDFSREGLEQGIAMAARGCEADPAGSLSQSVLGLGLAWAHGLGPAEGPLHRAIENNPDSWFSLSNLSLYATYLGKPELAREHIARAKVVNPVPPLWLYEFECLSYFPEERFAEVLPGVEAIPDGVWDGMYLLACYGHLGEKEKARSLLARYRDRPMPDFVAGAMNEPYAFPATQRLLVEGVRKALAF